MADAKSFLDLTMADLKTRADFKDDGVPAPGLSEKAASAPVKSVSAAALISRSQSASKELIEFQNELGVGANDDEILDVPYRAELDDFERRGVDFGSFLERYDEANSLFDLDAELNDRSFSSVGERNKAALRMLADYDAILASPARAQQELDDFYARDIKTDPLAKRFFYGDSDDPIKDTITRLIQAANGEKPVGRPKRRGDGFVY